MSVSGGNSPRIISVAVLLCLLCIGLVAGVAPVDAEATDGGFGNVETEAFEADRTTFIITVRDDGSAEWRFRYEQRLDDDQIEDFETYAERFNDEETESYRNFRERAIALTETGSETTDREMTADGFEREARIEERPPAGESFAVIEMSFEWTGLAVVEDGSVTVGDVFVAGLYVGPDQHLRFDRGPSLEFGSATPTPDSTASESLSESETITWHGERSFADREPRVVFVERSVGTEQNGTDGGSESADGSPETDRSEPGSADRWALPLVVIVLIALLGSAVVFAYRGSSISAGSAETDSDAGETSSDSRESGSGTVPSGHSSDGTEPIIDGEIVSDEQRVVKLLEARGGRMKQVDIVERTDWSKSKVSMLLSEMESDGTVSKLRVGRENIVSLAGHEPDATESPFGDE